MQQGGNPSARAEMKEPSAPREVQVSICRGHICHGAMAHLLQWVMVRDRAQAQGLASGLLQDAAHKLVTKKAEENCKTHLPRKWGRNISGFGTTSHFCTQKSCQSSKNTADHEYKHDSYHFTIPKILGVESSSR